MAKELKEFNEEEALLKKKRQRKRIRGLLIVANVLLVSYFSYLLVDLIVDHVKEKEQVINGELIQLVDKSTAKSKEIYDAHISTSIDVNDFSLYGKYLLTSSNRVSYNSLNYESNIWLVNLLSDPFVIDNNLKYKLGDKLDEQLDLFTLASGDYMICKDINLVDKKGICYHYTGEELLEKTIYSFPDENNHRKKITIKGKDSSPALIISVEQINLLPKSYYDFVVIGEQKDFDIFKNTPYQVKYVSSLKDAYLTNASYAINLLDQEEGIYTSNYVSYESLKPTLIEGSAYNHLDSDNAIRELGGYVFNAGFGVTSEEATEDISKASLEIKKTNQEVRTGKYTISVGNKVTLDKVLEAFKIK